MKDELRHITQIVITRQFPIKFIDLTILYFINYSIVGFIKMPTSIVIIKPIIIESIK